jgi:hypothetical protein
MGHIVAFKPQSGPWTPRERSILADVKRALEQLGMMTDCQHGASDSNTPWTAFYTIDRGSFVAHVARYERGYVLLWPDHSSILVQEMDSLLEAVRSSAIQHALVMSGSD